MHNTTRDEIEKSLEDYPLIPMNDIEDEARLLAVRWVEGYEPAGFDLPHKHKLASDIMNYAIRHHKTRSNFEVFAIESIKENERIHQQIGEVDKPEELQEEVERLRDALNQIATMKRSSAEEWVYPFNRCYHIAMNALEFKK